MKSIDVRTSPIHGLGVFAIRPLDAGEFLGRYEGRRYRASEADSVVSRDDLTYLFALSDGSLIDGSCDGNLTRHLNHSCEPNCAAYEVRTRGRTVIRIHALHAIEAGAELFLDYRLDVPAGQRDLYPCRCDAPSCRGTMADTSPM